MVLIKLLTSPKCPMCPKAKEVVRRLKEIEKDVKVLELSVATDKGFKEAVKFGIRVVPAIIINDRYVIIGVPSLDELREVVERFRGT